MLRFYGWTFGWKITWFFPGSAVFPTWINEILHSPFRSLPVWFVAESGTIVAGVLGERYHPGSPAPCSVIVVTEVQRVQGRWQQMWMVRGCAKEKALSQMLLFSGCRFLISAMAVASRHFCLRRTARKSFNAWCRGWQEHITSQRQEAAKTFTTLWDQRGT